MLKANKLFFTSFLICLFTGLMLLFLNKFLDGNVIWVGKLGNGGQYAEYCELNQFSKFLRQPMNSYSNLAFLFFGISVVGLGISDYRIKNTGNPLFGFPAFSILQGIYFCYLFLGSTYYHASLTWTVTSGYECHLCPYTWFAWLCRLQKFFIFYKTRKEPSNRCNYCFIGFELPFCLYSSYYQQYHIIAFFIWLSRYSNCIFLYKNTKKFNTNFLILSIVSMIIAIVVRTLDVKKIGCDPLSIFQGHALWHLLTGMGGYFMYLFYRSEKSFK
ncbi:MAG: hypothetical protein IPN09_09915 [Bacteroidetes bacterium]|nr:hypothetical protein [Bacteroidota bacterium]